jgi:predicted DNA-binding transcriptional regulator AlpA
VHYPDAVIAAILNRQGRMTAYGYRFDRNRVGNVRRYSNIPSFQEKPRADADLMSVKQAAVALGVAASTIHRLLNDGIIGGEQVTPCAPWRIRMSDELKARFNCEAVDSFLPMREAMRALGVSRQTVLQRVKRGELEAVHVTRGKQKGLRIKVLDQQSSLFDHTA